MIDSSNEYSLFFKFIDKYISSGFEGIDPGDPLMLKLEAMMKKNNQFFYMGDVLQFQIKYTSKRSYQMFGIESEKLEPGIIFSNTHPDDQHRHTISRSRVFKLAGELFIGTDEYAIVSSNLRFLNPQGAYTNTLVQAYLFKNKAAPINTVYGLFIQTDIDWFGKIKHGYNYYLGTNLSYFRVPDKKLILTGCIFTDREFEILILIKEGLSSEQISEKLFLSIHTIDTHRRNILKKSSKPNTSELIIELMERGVF